MAEKQPYAQQSAKRIGEVRCMAGKVENKNLEEYENENYYLLW